MEEFFFIHENEILIIACAIVYALLIAGSIVLRYLKDKHGPWTL